MVLVKHAVLRSIAHNLADSISSGCCLLISDHDIGVYDEAKQTEEKCITVDLLQGTVLEHGASIKLTSQIRQCSVALEGLARSQGASCREFTEITVRFWTNELTNRFSVSVRDRDGRRTTTEFTGRPGKRVRVLDALGRPRPLPPTKVVLHPGGLAAT